MLSINPRFIADKYRSIGVVLILDFGIWNADLANGKRMLQPVRFLSNPKSGF
jgi:hypothetical protein